MPVSLALGGGPTPVSVGEETSDLCFLRWGWVRKLRQAISGVEATYAATVVSAPEEALCEAHVCVTCKCV